MKEKIHNTVIIPSDGKLSDSETEAGEALWVQSQPGLRNEFQAS